MITHPTKKTSSTGKEYWQFSVMLSLAGLALESTGWRYWPETDTIKPPQVRVGKAWINTFKGLHAAQSDLLKGALKAYIRGIRVGDSSCPEGRLARELRELFEQDQDAFMHTVPSLYRTQVMMHPDLTPERRAEFDDLPDGRLWPDSALEVLVEQVSAGTVDLTELTWRVDNGVIARGDCLWVLGKVKERGE